MKLSTLILDIQEEQKNSADRCSRKIAFATKHEEVISRILKAFEDEPILNNGEEKESEELPYSFDITPYAIGIYLTGNTERLNKAFGILRRLVGPADNHIEEKAEYIDTTFRNFNTEFKAYFNFSSTVCKMVQVGTELIEKPIYELRCDE